MIERWEIGVNGEWWIFWDDMPAKCSGRDDIAMELVCGSDETS